MSNASSWKDRVMSGNGNGGPVASSRGVRSGTARDSARTGSNDVRKRGGGGGGGGRRRNGSRSRTHSGRAQGSGHSGSGRATGDEVLGGRGRPATAAQPVQEKAATVTKAVGGQSVTIHNLTTPWTLYYHSPSLQDWSVTSYMEVATFGTAEEFWAVFGKLPEANFHMGMFFFMRQDIKPTWEDPQNARGGCWSYKIPMRHIYPVWKGLCALLVGESLSTVPMLLNGLSVSPKRGFCIVKVWGNDCKKCDAKLLKLEGVEHMGESEALYTPFKEKK